MKKQNKKTIVEEKTRKLSCNNLKDQENILEIVSFQRISRKRLVSQLKIYISEGPSLQCSKLSLCLRHQCLTSKLYLRFQLQHFPLSFPLNVHLGNRRWPKHLGPWLAHKDLDGLPGSWFPPDSDLAVAAIWEATQWKKDSCLLLSF